MKCQMCNEKEASIVFTQVVNNNKVVLHICPECAQKKGLSIEIISAAPAAQKIMISTAPAAKESLELPNIVCHNCGLTFAEFKQSGLFGCDKCPMAFNVHVDEVLKQIHGTAEHCGHSPKPPQEADVLRQIKSLRSKLKHCIEMEDYEQAAILRDQISDLQKGTEKK